MYVRNMSSVDILTFCIQLAYYFAAIKVEQLGRVENNVAAEQCSNYQGNSTCFILKITIVLRLYSQHAGMSVNTIFSYFNILCC